MPLPGPQNFPDLSVSVYSWGPRVLPPNAPAGVLVFSRVGFRSPKDDQQRAVCLFGTAVVSPSGTGALQHWHATSLGRRRRAYALSAFAVEVFFACPRRHRRCALRRMAISMAGAMALQAAALREPRPDADQRPADTVDEVAPACPRSVVSKSWRTRPTARAGAARLRGGSARRACSWLLTASAPSAATRAHAAQVADADMTNQSCGCMGSGALPPGLSEGPWRKLPANGPTTPAAPHITRAASPGTGMGRYRHDREFPLHGHARALGDERHEETL